MHTCPLDDKLRNIALDYNMPSNSENSNLAQMTSCSLNRSLHCAEKNTLKINSDTLLWHRAKEATTIYEIMSRCCHGRTFHYHLLRNYSLLRPLSCLEKSRFECLCNAFVIFKRLKSVLNLDFIFMAFELARADDRKR